MKKLILIAVTLFASMSIAESKEKDLSATAAAKAGLAVAMDLLRADEYAYANMIKDVKTLQTEDSIIVKVVFDSREGSECWKFTYDLNLAEQSQEFTCD